MKKLFLALALTGVMISQTGCFGEFGLTRKVYEFNQGVGGNKVPYTTVDGHQFRMTTQPNYLSILV